jgi:hypothetical protein
LTLNPSQCVQNRGVISTAKRATDVHKGFVEVRFDQIHGHLPGRDDRFVPALRLQIDDADFVVLRRDALNLIY